MGGQVMQKMPQIISETNFSSDMDNEVIPFLTPIRQCDYLPIDASRGDAGRLYYETYCPPNAHSALVISHGFCETIEKYKEVIYYFVKMGFQVYLADQRGHGRSLRDTGHANMVHINRFEDYVETLHHFVLSVVKPKTRSIPLYLYAHSMGGGIGALYLETYPDTFQKAILTSPMLAISMGPVPAFLAKGLGFLMVKLGRAESYAPGQHAFISGEKWEESGSACEERFRYYQQKKESTPLFQNSGSCYGWAYQSLCACHRITQKRNCAKITVPVLVFQSKNDTFVKASAIRRFVQYTTTAKLVSIEGSRHEIYNSHQKVLIPYYQEIFRFLESE